VANAGYVLGAWGLTAVSVAVYAVSLLRRGRRLSPRVAPDRRRWMSAVDPEGGHGMARLAAPDCRGRRWVSAVAPDGEPDRT